MLFLWEYFLIKKYILNQPKAAQSADLKHYWLLWTFDWTYGAWLCSSSFSSCQISYCCTFGFDHVLL